MGLCGLNICTTNSYQNGYVTGFIMRMVGNGAPHETDTI